VLIFKGLHSFGDFILWSDQFNLIIFTKDMGVNL